MAERLNKDSFQEKVLMHQVLQSQTSTLTVVFHAKSYLRYLQIWTKNIQTYTSEK